MADTLPTFDVATIDYSAWPTKAEVAARLYTLGHLPTDNLSPTADPLLTPQQRQAIEFAMISMESKIVSFEESVHSNPFKASADGVVKVFETGDLHSRTTTHARSYFVQLPAYLISLTKLEISCTPDFAELTELTLGTHFDLHEKEGFGECHPYTHIGFIAGGHSLCNCGNGRRGYLRLTGKWGYCTTLPGDIRELMTQYAVMDATQSLISQGASCLSPGDKRTIEAGPIKTTLTGGSVSAGASVSKRYGDAEQRKVLSRQFRALVERYRLRHGSG